MSNWRKVSGNQQARAANTSDSAANVRVFQRKNKDVEEIVASPNLPLVSNTAPSNLQKMEVVEKKIEMNQRIMMTNKACHVMPQHEDFGQHTTPAVSTSAMDQYQKLLLDQYGFDPIALDQLKELHKLLFQAYPKVENSSQYANPDLTDTLEVSGWHNVETIDDIDQIFKHDEKPPDRIKNQSLKNIQISETPRVKVMAQKYSKLKKNNVELRKLDEKIVCVEYDVFDAEKGYSSKPVQVMRAFFSIKTGCDNCNGASLLEEVPSNIKNKIEINEEDVKNLTEKEIEIIDEKITENRPYLDDLKRVLRKKRALSQKKKKSSLDLVSMYDMARRECPPLDYNFSNTNLLSKAELSEMKGLILQNCESGGYGISRRPLKGNGKNDVKSDSVFFDDNK